jgi:hypothetical protein
MAQVVKQLPGKWKVQGCEFILQYHQKKKRRNDIGHILFMSLLISLGHLRSCGSSLLSVDS